MFICGYSRLLCIVSVMESTFRSAKNDFSLILCIVSMNWFCVLVSPGLLVVAGGEAALEKGEPHPFLSGSGFSAAKCNLREYYFIL